MAATSSHSRRKQQDGKEQAARRAALKKQRARRRRHAIAVFDKIAGIDQMISESQVKYFIAQAMEFAEDELDPYAVQLVIDTARQNQGTEGSFQKEPLLEAEEKYGEYIRHSKTINEMYKNCDKDGDGGLSRREFQRALDAYERKANRSVDGFTVQLCMTDADYDLILEQADANKDGQISRNEMLPALAAWEELATIKLENTNVCSCTIL
jgi:hypothetical protein